MGLGGGEAHLHLHQRFWPLPPFVRNSALITGSLRGLKTKDWGWVTGGGNSIFAALEKSSVLEWDFGVTLS